MDQTTASNNIEKSTRDALRTVAIVGCVCFILVGANLIRNDFDPSIFVVAGENYTNEEALDPALTVVLPGNGYDGQFYYRLALDPFSKITDDFGIRLDLPSYRGQRIVYPLSVWLISFGNPSLALWGMILVNLAGMMGLAYVSAQLAEHYGRRAYWGLLIALYPGFMLALVRDLTEILTGLFVLWGTLEYLRHRRGIASALLILAVLTRETALLVPIAFLSVALLRRARNDRADGDGKRLVWMALPIVVYGVWAMVCAVRWDSATFSDRGFLFGWPFAGVLGLVGNATQIDLYYRILWTTEILLLLAWSGLAGYVIIRSRSFSYVYAAWALNAGMVSVLAVDVWLDDWGFLRLTSVLHCFSALVLFGTNLPRTEQLLRVLSAAWFVNIAYHVIALST